MATSYTRVIIIGKKRFFLLFLALIIIAAGAWTGYTLYQKSLPVRIGVLLPMTGDVELREPLEWARDSINEQGGIAGRQIELVYADTGSGNNTALLAQRLLADNSVRIVIGPPTSDDVFSLAPEFIQKQKLLISPLATSGDIFRAFGKKGYFWRTTQGDVAQVKTIIMLLKERGVQRAALLTENTTYGSTFYDWTGFFATEYGLNLGFVRQFEPGSTALDRDVADALQTEPDYIIAVCGRPTDAAEIKKAIDRSGKPARLFLADAAATPVLVSTLGSAAEGLEGTSPTADPSTSFSLTYQEKFGHPPTDYAGPAYDALLLAAYTSARQEAAPSESLADSIRYVVYGNGTPRGWSAGDASAAVREILAGGNPDISGASGPLDYDTEFGVDPLTTYFSSWIIDGGEYRVARVLGYEKAGVPAVMGESVSRTHASRNLMALPAPVKGRYVPGVNRTDFQAVVVGSSSGWKNYRHQSDALAMYTLLREQGVPDDHIILMIYDDVATAPENPIQGDVHNTVGGKNLRAGAEVDYSGPQVTAAALRNILLGVRTAEQPLVLESGAGTDVFVYMASHGTSGSIAFSDPNESFSAEDFTGITGGMEQEGKYRQMIVILDSCFGESIGKDVTAKGLLFFTGANGNEPSFGATYDMGIKQWLSDEFTARIMSSVRSDPDITIRELYIAAYDKVTGSHVRLLNTENFGSIDVGLVEFLTP